MALSSTPPTAVSFDIPRNNEIILCITLGRQYNNGVGMSYDDVFKSDEIITTIFRSIDSDFKNLNKPPSIPQYFYLN